MSRAPTEAYPLQWPDGWPRTRSHDRKYSLPGGRNGGQSWSAVVRRLNDELCRLGAGRVVLSTNQPVRQDGQPYAARRIIDDPGAAVYFTLNDRPLVMAQDRYERLIDNFRSLALAIEGLRQMERHGGAHMMERAFAGFKALPDPSSITPGFTSRTAAEFLAAVCGENVGAADLLASPENVRLAYRAAAKRLHPDTGGDAQQFNLAAEAKRVLSIHHGVTTNT